MFREYDLQGQKQHRGGWGGVQRIEVMGVSTHFSEFRFWFWFVWLANWAAVNMTTANPKNRTASFFGAFQKEPFVLRLRTNSSDWRKRQPGFESTRLQINSSDSCWSESTRLQMNLWDSHKSRLVCEWIHQICIRIDWVANECIGFTLIRVDSIANEFIGFT